MATHGDFSGVVTPCCPVDEQMHDYLFYVQFLENDRLIYVFDRFINLKWFLKLIDIQGIGCKLASRILQALPYDLFGQTIAHQDLTTLSAISGVSVKLASRIFDAFAGSELIDLGREDQTISQGYIQVRAVLKSLELSDEAINSILASIMKEDPLDEAAMLKAALRMVDHG